MEKDDINEKIDYIYSLEECSKLNEKDIQKLKILAADSEEEIRLAVSEVLALFTDETSEKILLSMLNDTSYLVQASTCDSLYFSSSLSTLTVLKGLSKHNRVLVRGYAALSIGDIQKRILTNCNETCSFLETWFKKEQSSWVKTMIARSLYLLGNDSYSVFLLEQLDNRCYKNRCLVLNLLSELAETDLSNHLQYMLPALKKHLNIEKVGHIKERLQSLIDKINVEDPAKK